jgi:hypothetical protein
VILFSKKVFSGASQINEEARRTSRRCIKHAVIDSKYYLVDYGYPNRTGYLTPFKGSTHIDDASIFICTGPNEE